MKLNLKSILLGKSNLALLASNNGILIAPKETIEKMASYNGKVNAYGLCEYNLSEQDSEQVARDFLTDIISGELRVFGRNHANGRIVESHIYVPLTLEIAVDDEDYTNER